MTIICNLLLRNYSMEVSILLFSIWISPCEGLYSDRQCPFSVLSQSNCSGLKAHRGLKVIGLLSYRLPGAQYDSANSVVYLSCPSLYKRVGRPIHAINRNIIRLILWARSDIVDLDSIFVLSA